MNREITIQLNTENLHFRILKKLISLYEIRNQDLQNLTKDEEYDLKNFAYEVILNNISVLNDQERP
jgi:hypothetical protein